MKVKDLFEAGQVIDFRDPDHDPEVNKALGRAYADADKRDKMAATQWVEFASEFDAKAEIRQFMDARKTPYVTITNMKTAEAKFDIRGTRPGDQQLLIFSPAIKRDAYTEKSIMKMWKENGLGDLYPHELRSYSSSHGPRVIDAISFGYFGFLDSELKTQEFVEFVDALSEFIGGLDKTELAEGSGKFGVKMGGVSSEKPEVGFESRSNFKAAKTACDDAGIQYKTSSNFGISYMIFDSEATQKKAVRLIKKVIDKSTESEW